MKQYLKHTDAAVMLLDLLQCVSFDFYYIISIWCLWVDSNSAAYHERQKPS